MAVERTPEQWSQLCADHITGGYVPGGWRKARLLYENGKAYVDILRELDLWKRGDTVVDIGCGNGRIAMHLVDDGVTYHGVDMVEKCIVFCRMAFEPYSDFHFYHIDAFNDRYNKAGRLAIAEVEFPLGDTIADSVIASSLFSHLGAWRNAVHYLSEIARISKAGAAFYSTWFTAPPNRPNDECDRSVYSKSQIRLGLRHHFEILREWGGMTGNPNDQMKVIAYRN